MTKHKIQNKHKIQISNAKDCVLTFGVFILNLFCALNFVICHSYVLAQDAQKEEPVIVNGDRVEYFTEASEVTAEGNVEVNYKGSKLTCDKLTVNTKTNDATATGKVRLDDTKGVIEGTKSVYNFNSKAGKIDNALFRSDPYFGKGKEVEKIDDKHFVSKKGYMSTCSYDDPHYRFKSSRIDFYPGDKVKTKNNVLFIRRAPLFYLPMYNHSLKEPWMHVQVMPGKKKDWGVFLLTAWRYTINENMKGRIYADYREKLGPAQGFGLNYTTGNLGKGDFKYYYTQERPHNYDEGLPAEFQRYLIRLRHKWYVDKSTDVTAEYYKITDSKRMLLGAEHNMLKDYFFREYEKDSLPLSYISVHRSFDYSSLDFILQKRTNRWYSQLEKLPQIKYTAPSLQMGESPFYYDNSSEAASFNYKYAVPSSSRNDIDLVRFDTVNKVSLPMKVSFIQLKPFGQNQETFYNKDINDSSISPRTIFSSGADASTKFYRVFNVKTNFLKMDINGLRHIITPTVGYGYTHEPTILGNKLRQIDSVDNIGRGNSAALELSNKLQTKRKKETVNLLDFRVGSTYSFKPKGGRGSSLSDISYDLEFLPYSWVRFDVDTGYNHYEDYFTAINYDVNFSFGSERTIGFGQRNQRKGTNEITTDFKWRLNPKWKFGVYERYNQRNVSQAKLGLREQEYFIARDLHCWTVEFTYNVKKEEGETVWLIFRIKAFPEMEFEYNKSYHNPKPGTQTEF